MMPGKKPVFGKQTDDAVIAPAAVCTNLLTCACAFTDSARCCDRHNAVVNNAVAVVVFAVADFGRAGVHRLRGLVISHPHRDHCGGAGAVLRGLAVDTVYVAAASASDSAYARLQALAPRTPWRRLRAGQRLTLDGTYGATVLWPESTDVLRSGANGCSLVLWARGGQHPDLLLMGDLEADGEARLLSLWSAALAEAAPELLVLKAGHHGSDTSSSPAFLDIVRPEVAVLSVGLHNRYAHPGRHTLAALEHAHCVVLRTDLDGAVRVTQRGASLWVERPGERAHTLVLGPG